MREIKTFIAPDGLSLAYRDEGAGMPLLCLAGLTRNSRDFDDFIAAAPPRFRFIRLDSRGRGASAHDPHYSNYNIMTEAADAVALLDHLGVERATLIGSSRGGLLSMVIAATAPERLNGVILNDVGPELKPEGLGAIMTYLGLPPAAKTLDEAAAGMAIAFATDFPGTDAAFWRDWAERGYVETPAGLTLAYDPKLRDATLEQAAAVDPSGPGLWPLFAALLPVPTLVLRGENSNLLSAEGVAAMQAQKPDLKTATVANRGHIPRLDEPDALAPMLAFLDDLNE